MTDWPDLHIGKGNRNFWVEIKAAKGKPTEGQSKQHRLMQEWGMGVLLANDLDRLLRWLGDIH